MPWGVAEEPHLAEHVTPPFTHFAQILLQSAAQPSGGLQDHQCWNGWAEALRGRPPTRFSSFHVIYTGTESST